MECHLNKQNQNFNVIIKNIKMEYPNLQIASYCPNWKSQIINGEDLKLDDDFDLNGVRNFFDGILLENIIIKTVVILVNF